MKKTSDSNLCARIQKRIVSQEDLPEKQQRAVAEHILKCPKCSTFAAFQRRLKDEMMQDKEAWQPQLATCKRLEQHLASRRTGQRRFMPNWLTDFLGYRIPVYQLMAAGLLLSGLYWSVFRLHFAMKHETTWYGTCRIDAAIIQTGPASAILQNISVQKIGRPISEDSLYSRFTFTM